MKLWKDNRIDGEYSMTCDEIAAAYLKSKEAKIEYWPLRRKILAFICGHEGLNSAMGDGPSIERNLRKIEQRIMDRQSPEDW